MMGLMSESGPSKLGTSLKDFRDVGEVAIGFL